MLDVFLTIDTEIWPQHQKAVDGALRKEMDRNIYGRTAAGEYGIRYQMDLLNRMGLKANFFVEGLSSCAVGQPWLAETVQAIRTAGHEVHLHIHAEWVAMIAGGKFLDRPANMRDFTQEQQASMIARAMENFRACGVEAVHAFRAGNYGADFQTLRALAKLGIPYDTSHNTLYLGSTCGLGTGGLLLGPREFFGVVEFPVSFFRDFPRHFRCLQLGACSFWEIRRVLLDAWARHWHNVVLVLHSFELLKPRRFDADGRPRHDPIMVRRFTRLCEFLRDNRDKFRAALFSQVDPAGIPQGTHTTPLRSYAVLAAQRLCEQLVRRVA